MSEEQYLIALGNLENMAIDNTKESRAVEICVKDINNYVERLNKELNKYRYTPKAHFKETMELRNRIARANNYIDQVLLYRIPNKTKEVYDDIEKLQSILNGSDKE